MNVVIHWFRRDLRIADNTALHEAGRRGDRVIPVFILEEAFRTGPDVGAGRLAFLLQSAEALRKNLAELGCPLVIRSGRSEDLLPRLCAETGARAVFANQRTEPYARARDRRLGETLFRAGVEFKLYKDAVVWEDAEILSQAGQPYTVFTPYSKAWKLRPVSLPCPKFKPITTARSSGSIPEVASEDLSMDPAVFGHPCRQTLPPAGERAALELLRKFMAGPVLAYSEKRNFPAVTGTSQLSPHLRAGTIGIPLGATGCMCPRW